MKCAVMTIGVRVAELSAGMGLVTLQPTPHTLSVYPDSLYGFIITSPLRSRWQAHAAWGGELCIAVTSGPRHELLLNVELVLRMVFKAQGKLKAPAVAARRPRHPAKEEIESRAAAGLLIIHVNLVLCIQQTVHRALSRCCGSTFGLFFVRRIIRSVYTRDCVEIVSS